MAKSFVNLSFDNGVYILESDTIDIKIDTNRKIYVKRHDENVYNYIDEDIQQGLTKNEKIQFMFQLYKELVGALGLTSESEPKEETNSNNPQKHL